MHQPEEAVRGARQEAGAKRAAAPAPFEENPRQRAQRNFSELIQELRVAALGIQVLFGFLLALPFTDPHFGRVDQAQRELYLATLLLSALATVALGAPVAYHRIVFRRDEKERLVQVSNGFALAGLTLVALAVSCAVGLVVSAVESGWLTPLLCALVFACFASVWLVVPLVARRR